jgi:hypothetical protein
VIVNRVDGEAGEGREEGEVGGSEFFWEGEFLDGGDVVSDVEEGDEAVAVLSGAGGELAGHPFVGEELPGFADDAEEEEGGGGGRGVDFKEDLDLNFVWKDGWG